MSEDARVRRPGTVSRPADVSIHASAVAIAGRAVLLRGPPGAGKSDLALRLVLGPPPAGMSPDAHLIGDDRILLAEDPEGLLASAVPALAGRLEVRGVGLVEFAPASAVPVGLVVDLVALEHVPRLPEDDVRVELAGHLVPLVRLWAFEPSAPLKVRLALARAVGSGWPVSSP